MSETTGWVGPVPEGRPWLKHYDDFVPHHLDYPRVPLDALLDQTADAHPDRPCTRFFGRQLSYREVRDYALAFAAALRKRGVREGDKVVLLLPNSPQFVIAYFGLLKAGAVVVPLNPLSSERELAFFFTDSEAETAVTIPLFLDKVTTLVGKTPLRRVICSRLSDFLPFPLCLLMRLQERRQMRGAPLAAVEQFSALIHEPLPKDFSPHRARLEDLACLIYSGGTTGVAKGIMLSHFSLVANAHQISAWGRLSSEEGRILAVLPLFHGFGMSVTMNSAVLVGGEIVLVPKFAARDVLKAIQQTRPIFFIGVPTMFVAFSNLPDVAHYDLSSLKGIFVGAAPLTRAIKDDFEGKTGGRMIEGYGLTESVTAIMANPYQGMHKLGSIGIPFPDVDVKIVSLDDGSDLLPGQLGEIVLRSPTVMLGYYRNPEETRKALVDGWLFTGDIGYMDEDGYFYITDRKKELIIVGGFNVFPREIDELIYQHPKVKEGITVGLPDAYKGEKIKVFVVLKEGEQATREEFIAYFRERLTPYKVPSDVEFRSELPKSMIGKILRRALREEEASRGRAAPGEGEAPN
jgi:long-chain acyl-CoA synthetase